MMIFRDFAHFALELVAEIGDNVFRETRRAGGEYVQHH